MILYGKPVADALREHYAEWIEAMAWQRTLTVIVNGEKAAIHVFEQERLPGEALILHYEPLDIRSLRLELSGGLGLSEVIVTTGE